MNPQYKAEWIKRLRSGEIEQRVGILGSANGKRCCLGVLSDIAVERGVCKTNKVHFIVTYDREDLLLPESVMNTADVEDNTVTINLGLTGRQRDTGFPLTVNLASLNDSGFTFNQIADVIDYFL